MALTVEPVPRTRRYIRALAQITCSRCGGGFVMNARDPRIHNLIPRLEATHECADVPESVAV